MSEQNLNQYEPGNGNNSGQGDPGNKGNEGRNGSGGSGKDPKRQSIVLFLIAALVTLLLMSSFMKMMSGETQKEISYNEFIQMLEDNKVESVTISTDRVNIKPKEEEKANKLLYLYGSPSAVTYYTGKIEDDDTLTQRLLKYDVPVKGEVADSSSVIISFLLTYVVPILLMWVLLSFLFRKMSKGGGPMGVGKSTAKVYVQKETGITFKDVAGEDEAKESLQEVVDFLHNPGKYAKIGAKLPKGALLVGPPGTGKTLLAKAVAGEAGVPFFSMSGSDFVEMFVGVGASRVRDLFRQAKEKAPCIIFIDEIDAVGRARSQNPSMGSNDERESTLNALLTEMDGFGTNSGIIVLAATNRADMLDKALLRAGRFDRQISVDLPDLNERKAIFEVHLRPIKRDASVDVEMLARQTPGFSGADIANVCNEAALIAARHGKKSVEKQDFLDAVDRIIGGLEKKTKVMTASEKRSIAIHEAGHATISWFTEHANPLVKVSIVPRGRALGAAWYMPEERQITTKEAMLDEICSLLGGRAAEELFTGHISTGAINDLERVTKSIYGMIAYAGMGTNLPNISYYNNNEYNFQKPYSETTAKAIDDEAIRMIAEQYDRAKAILTEHKEGHNQLAQLLIEREVIFAEDVEKIFGKRQWVSRSQEILEETNSKAESSTGSEPAKDAEGHNDTESTEGTENTENSTTTSTDDQNQ